MDLGIKGRGAIVCGSSKGLGFGCAQALAAAGVEVVLNGRSANALADAQSRISAETGRVVKAIAADVTTAEGRQALLAVMPDPDILVTNAAGPPPGSFEQWDEADWSNALNANMIAPIQMIRSVMDGMRERKWGRVINITSSAVKEPIPFLGLSNGARSGLTGFVAGLARQVAGDGVTVNNLLPGPFETDRMKGMAKLMADQRGVEPGQIIAEMAQANPMGRVGRPEEFGAACAFLASVHAGFITGQNILLDGGQYRGTL